MKLVDNKDGSGALVTVFDEFGFRIGSDRCKMLGLEKDSEIEVGRLSLQVLETLKPVGIADKIPSGVENEIGSGSNVIPVKQNGGLRPSACHSTDSETSSRAAMRVVETNCQGLQGTECHDTVMPSVRNTVNVPRTRFSFPQISSVSIKGPPFRKSFSCPQSMIHHQVTPSMTKRPAGKFSRSITGETVGKSRSGFVTPRPLAEDRRPEDPTVAPSASSLDPTDLILEEGPLPLSLGTSLAKHLKRHQRTGVQVGIEPLLFNIVFILGSRAEHLSKQTPKLITALMEIVHVEKAQRGGWCHPGRRHGSW